MYYAKNEERLKTELNERVTQLLKAGGYNNCLFVADYLSNRSYISVWSLNEQRIQYNIIIPDIDKIEYHIFKYQLCKKQDFSIQ